MADGTHIAEPPAHILALPDLEPVQLTVNLFVYYRVARESCQVEIPVSLTCYALYRHVSLVSIGESINRCKPGIATPPPVLRLTQCRPQSTLGSVALLIRVFHGGTEPMQSLRVLVAEDEPLTRTILRARLEKLAHQVVGEAQNGVEAVELARLHKPDVIIMDIRMPEMDGIEAAKVIMSERPCAVLFLTAFNDQAMVEQASEAGALAYLMKPFRKEDLAPALEIAVRRFRQIADQSKQIDELKEAIETRKVVEKAKGILMDRMGLTEEDAFKRIHFQARNQNKKMREIAESIITASELI